MYYIWFEILINFIQIFFFKFQKKKIKDQENNILNSERQNSAQKTVYSLKSKQRFKINPYLHRTEMPPSRCDEFRLTDRKSNYNSKFISTFTQTAADMTRKPVKRAVISFSRLVTVFFLFVFLLFISLKCNEHNLQSTVFVPITIITERWERVAFHFTKICWIIVEKCDFNQNNYEIWDKSTHFDS